MKNHNFPILLVILVLVAALAQFLRLSPAHGQIAIRQDLEKSLQLLWDREGQRVELTPTGLRATVSMPPNVTTRQQRWNYPFLRFVARRHPALKLNKLQVFDGSSQRAVPEMVGSGILAEFDGQENISLFISRRLTAELEVVAGQGRALVLADAHRPQAGRDAVRYGCRIFSPPRSSPPMRLEVYLVVPQILTPGAIRRFQSDHLAHGETVQVVRLPTP